MPERDVNSDRFFESLLTGVPMHSHIRTPDGRLLLEMHRQGEAEARRHEELKGIQGELVRTLRDANQGSTTITRTDFQTKQADVLPVFREAVSRIQELGFIQGDLLEQGRVLTRITDRGFAVLQDEVAGVRSELRGVRADLGDLGDQVAGEVRRATQTLQGPTFPAETLTTLARGQMFFDALSAYLKGFLTPQAKWELENLIDERLHFPQAKVAVAEFIAQKIKEEVAKMRKKARDRDDEAKWAATQRDMTNHAMQITTVIDTPSELVTDVSVAEEKLGVLQKLTRSCQDESLDEFVKAGLAFLVLVRKAKAAPVAKQFLADLSNSGHLTPAMHHRVKRTDREARLAGTAVDRNYNLMEILEQGDHATNQRNTLISLGARQVALGEEGVRQRGTMIGQNQTLIKLGITQTVLGVAAVAELASISAKMDDQDRSLEAVVNNLAVSNDHLVNLERLGAEFVETMEFGFNAVGDALSEVAHEIAVSRAATLGQLKRMGVDIASQVAYGNQQLERLTTLAEESLKNVARQRAKQGFVFLRAAQSAEDFQEASRLFLEGIDEDPTYLENQFGLGLCLVALNSIEDAKKRFRTVIRLSGPGNEELASAASMQLAELEEKGGDFISSAEYLKKAGDLDPQNVEAKYKHARILILSGLKDEAVEVLTDLTVNNPFALPKLALDPAFSPDILLDVYKNFWDSGARRPLKVAAFLFEKFISSGERAMVLDVFKYVMSYGPRQLLKSGLSHAPSFSSIIPELAGVFKAETTDRGDAYSSEDWYAVALFALQANLSSGEILAYFKRGLEDDVDFQIGERQQVLVKLTELGSGHIQDFLREVSRADPSLTWLNNLS